LLLSTKKDKLPAKKLFKINLFILLNRQHAFSLMHFIALV